MTEQPTGSPQRPLNVLFFYRTKRKQRYFSRVMNVAPQGVSARAVSSFFPKSRARTNATLSRREADKFVDQLFLETFNGKQTSRRNPLVRLYLLIGRLLSKRLYRKYHALLSRQRPDLLCVWNGHKFPEPMLCAMAARLDIPVAYFENGLLPQTTTLDNQGVNAACSLPGEAGFYKAYDGECDQHIAIIPRKPDNKKLSNTQDDLPGRFLLAPFQVDGDSQLIFNSPWIRSMRHLYRVLDRLSARLPDDLHIVVREHPTTSATYEDLHELARDNPRLHFISDTPLVDTLSRAEAVLTINSTVGMEAILLGRKLVTLGDAIYNLPGLVLHAVDEASLDDCIDKLDGFAPDADLRHRFICYLKNEFLVPGDWKQPDDPHLQAVWRKLLVFSRAEPRNV
jgi:capsular polysaccharide export protein